MIGMMLDFLIGNACLKMARNIVIYGIFVIKCRLSSTSFQTKPTTLYKKNNPMILVAF